MSQIRKLRPSPGTAIAGAALLVALGGAAFAAIPDSGGIIHACYQKSDGHLRTVQSESECRNSENALRWNQQGPTGPQGPPGPPGPGDAEVVTLERSFLDDGETEVLFARGSLTLTARCRLDQPTTNQLVDIADVVLSTTKPDSFHGGGNFVVTPSNPAVVAEARLFHSGPTMNSNRDVHLLLAGAPDEPDLHGSIWAGIRQVGRSGCAFGGHIVSRDT